MTQKINDCEVELKRQLAKRKESTEIGRDLKRKLEYHRTNIEQREHDVAVVRKNLDESVANESIYRTRRIELEMRDEELLNSQKDENEAVGRANTGRDYHSFLSFGADFVSYFLRSCALTINYFFLMLL